MFAGELAASYAPELTVLGVAAGAPAADVEQILPLAGSIRGAAGYLVMGAEGFHAAYPDADPAAVLTPAALTKANVATTQCGDAVLQAYAGTSGTVLAHDPRSIPLIQNLLHENSAGNRPGRRAAAHRPGQRRHHHRPGAHRHVDDEGLRHR